MPQNADLRYIYECVDRIGISASCLAEGIVDNEVQVACAYSHPLLIVLTALHLVALCVLS